MAGHRSFGAARPILPSAQEHRLSRSISKARGRSGVKALAALCPGAHRLCSENRSCRMPTCHRARSLLVSGAMWPVWPTRRHRHGGKRHSDSRAGQRLRSAAPRPPRGDDHGRCMNGVDARSPVGPGRVPNGHTSVDLPTGLDGQQSPTGMVSVPPRMKLVYVALVALARARSAIVTPYCSATTVGLSPSTIVCSRLVHSPA